MEMAGTWIKFPVERRTVLDICHFARQVPMFPVEATFDLNNLALARERANTRISWVALFVRGMGLLSAEYPALRQSFLSWPWPHLYEHPNAVASVAMARTTAGRPFVAFARLERPEVCCLTELQAQLDGFQRRPADVAFREQLRFAGLPRPVRHVVWNLFLNGWGRKRSRKFGTFSVSTLAGQGTTNRMHPTVLSYSLSYGPLNADGECLVTLLCDHRVIDGLAAAQMLQRLQEVLQTQVLSELQSLGSPRAAA